MSASSFCSGLRYEEEPTCALVLVQITGTWSGSRVRGLFSPKCGPNAP